MTRAVILILLTVLCACAEQPRKLTADEISRAIAADLPKEKAP